MSDWFKGFAGRVAENLVASLIAAAILSAAFLGWITGAFEAVVTGDASLPAWALALGVVAIFAVG